MLKSSDGKSEIPLLFIRWGFHPIVVQQNWPRGFAQVRLLDLVAYPRQNAMLAHFQAHNRYSGIFYLFQDVFTSGTQFKNARRLSQEHILSRHFVASEIPQPLAGVSAPLGTAIEVCPVEKLLRFGEFHDSIGLGLR